MTERSDSSNLDRRGFLRGLGLTAGAGAAAVAGIGATTADAQAPAAPRQEAGYRETDHVRRAYEAASF